MPLITPALARAGAQAQASTGASSSSSSGNQVPRAPLDDHPARTSQTQTQTAAPTNLTAPNAVLGPQTLPLIPMFAVHDKATLDKISAPVKRIASEEDTAQWMQSSSYATYTLFVQRVAEACVGKPTRLPPRPSPSTSTNTSSRAKERLIPLLYELDSWTTDIEPHAKPQRFGNLAFRDWGARLEQRVDQLHRDLLPEHLHPFIKELRAYLLDAFGSFVRIDYGSGHELAFFAWLGYLYRLGFFFDADTDQAHQPPEQAQEFQTGLSEEQIMQVEESLGLEIFPLYLMVVWKIQDRYGLEPAGSHGVWGLDDFQFLPYVLGSAQFRAQAEIRPREIVTYSSDPTFLSSLPSRDPATLIGSAVRLPKSRTPTTTRRSVTSTTEDDDNEGRAAGTMIPNLYLTSLLRIQVLKRGPFHEHSPLLNDISTSVPNWIKVYTGMVKMYSAECLNKKVVVQHFPFGGVGWVFESAPTSTMEGGSTASSTSGSRSTAGGQATNTTATMIPTTMPTRTVFPSSTRAPAPSSSSAGLALGGSQGNLGSLGIPTTRMMGTVPSSAASQGATMMPPLRFDAASASAAARGRNGPGTMAPPAPPPGSNSNPSALPTRTAAPWATKSTSNTQPSDPESKP